MEWNIVVHDEAGYIEVITRGIADRDGSLNMAHAIAHAMRTNRMTNVLIDHGNIDALSGEVLDIYDRPKIFRLIGVIMRIKVAEIIKPEHWEHFRFFETGCHNQGYRLSVFQEKDKALEWLLTWMGVWSAHDFVYV